MNIRLAVGCALVVFFLSVATIIALGLTEPVHGVTIHASPVTGPSTDVGQIKRDFLAAPVVNQTLPVPQNPPTVQMPPVAQNDTPPAVVSPPAPDPQPVVQPPPPPPPDYYYYRPTRAS